MRRPRLALAVLALLAAAPLCAGEGGKLRAYRAARVVPRAGEAVAPGILVVRDGTVEAVLDAAAAVPEGAEVVDLGQAVILPGLVNPLSSISEADLGGGFARGTASGGAGQPGDMRGRKASGEVKPQSKLWRRLGRTGYAAWGWLPGTDGLLSGQACVLRPRRGKEKEGKDLVLRDPAYLFMNFELGKRWRDAAEGALKKAAEAIVKEREAKKKAEEARAAEKKEPEKKEPEKKEPEKKEPEKKEPEKKEPEKKEPEKKEPEKKEGEKPPAPPPPAGGAEAPKPAAGPEKPPAPPDPLEQAFRGEIPLFVRLRTPAVMDHFFRIVDALPVKPAFVLVTGVQPPETVEKVAARRNLIRAVVLEPRLGAWWETSIAVNGARLFAEKGLPVALVPVADSLEGHRAMLFHAAQLVRGGLREREALAAVTTVPASLLGLEGKAGVLAKGAAASFGVWSGEPLAGDARLVKMFIDGSEVYADDPLTGALAGEAVR
jgi:hypothetical protein